MREYRRRIVDDALEGLFEGDHDRQAAIDWWTASDGRRPVVLVGSGFSRNGLWKATGKPASDVATWEGVRARLVTDLRIPPERAAQYDTLTLADLYITRLGPGRLHDVLYDLVPDDELESGKAHQSLLDYDAEAIITTNHLDTLLDRKSSQWDRLVTDQDVSKHQPDCSRARQIIYFHGHRSDFGTWVVSRSHYEDLDVSRPIMVARVRQLLAQHPLLAVGYSLTDPDFHALYRRISHDMRRRQPRGLALVVERPDPAIEEYWRNLGIFVATIISERGDFAPSFCRFFASATPRVAPSRLIAMLGSDDDLFTRMHLLREYIDDPDRAHFVESSPRQDEQTLWDALEGRLPPERQRSAQAQRRLSPPVQARTSVQSEGTSTNVPYQEQALVHFPSGRFDRVDPRIRILDELVTIEGGWGGVAEWSRLVFDHRHLLDVAEEQRFFVLPSLLSWIWRRLVECDPTRVGEARILMRSASEHAARYELDELCEAIKQDLESLGSSAEREATVEILAPPATEERKRGFDAALNGDWQSAMDAYSRALDGATSASNPLAAWLAAEGRTWAALRLRSQASSSGSTPPDAKIEEFEAEAQRRKAHPEVAWWQERADRRVEECRKGTLERRRAVDSDREREVERFSFSNLQHYAWRSWKDLESYVAPPSIQAHYLEPLLELTGFSESAEELAVRLRLEISRTPEWFRNLLDNGARQEPDRIRLEAALSSVLHKASKASRTEQLGTLELIPLFANIARMEDLGWIHDFLSERSTKLGHVVETPHGDSFPIREKPAAWMALASLQLGEEALKTVQDAVQATVSQRRDELLRQLQTGTWYSWMLTGADHDTAISTVLGPAIDGLDIAQMDGPSAVGVTVATAGILFGARQIAKTLSSQSLGHARDWFDKASGRSYAAWILPDILHALTRLALELDLGELKAERSFSDRILECADAPIPADPNGFPVEFFSIELRCSVLAEFLVSTRAGVVDAALPRAGRLVEEIKSSWQKIKQHCQRNRRHCPPIARFLVAALLKSRTSNQTWIRQALLEMLNITTMVIPLLAPAIDPGIWGEDWTNVMTHLRVGGIRQARQSWLMGLVDLLGELSRLDPEDQKSPRNLTEDCQHLPDVAMLATTEQSQTLANHAGYAIVGWLEDTSDARIPFALRTLEKLAADSRTAVRHAAAYGAARLKCLAHDSLVRERMAALYERMKGDSTARVQRQLAIGLGEAELGVRLRPGVHSR